MCVVCVCVCWLEWVNLSMCIHSFRCDLCNILNAIVFLYHTNTHNHQRIDFGKDNNYHVLVKCCLFAGTESSMNNKFSLRLSSSLGHK